MWLNAGKGKQKLWKAFRNNVQLSLKAAELYSRFSAEHMVNKCLFMHIHARTHAHMHGHMHIPVVQLKVALYHLYALYPVCCFVCTTRKGYSEQSIQYLFLLLPG